MEANTDNFWEGKEFDEVFEELDRRGKIVEEKLAKVLKEVDDIVTKIKSKNPPSLKEDIPEERPAFFEVTRDFFYQRPFITPDDIDMDPIIDPFNRGYLADGLRKNNPSSIKAPPKEVWASGYGKSDYWVGRYKSLWGDKQIEGQWSAASLSGLGKKTDVNNVVGQRKRWVQEGQWGRGWAHGWSRFLQDNGDEFAGIWNEDQPNGPGVYRWRCGAEFRAMWAKGRTLEGGCIFDPGGRIRFASTSHGKGIELQMRFESSDPGKLRTFSIWFTANVKDYERDGSRFTGSILFSINSLVEMGVIPANDEGVLNQGFESVSNVLSLSANDVLELDAGYFVKVLREGYGVQIFANGDRYDGQWKNNRRDGRGTQYFANGDKFEGRWREGGMRNGQYVWANSDRFEGEFWGNKRDGNGVQVWVNGDRYEGIWREGLRWAGKQLWANGDVFEGVWSDDLRKKGKQVWANGDVYDGEWAEDRYNGKGVWISADGRRYEGNWVGGKRQGQGKQIEADGEIYEGSWLDDKKHGKGVESFPDGSKVECEFVKGNRHGQAFITDSNGATRMEYWRHGGIDTSVFASLRFHFILYTKRFIKWI